MRWVPDKRYGLGQRPHYETSEIDEICEDQITSFLIQKNGCLMFPIGTDDIEVLLEKVTSDFNPYADLPSDVEGKTRFLKIGNPEVQISNRLSADYLSNRRRTTLTHELGHVKFHSDLWRENEKEISCNRENIENAKSNDWMEWQAYYASGAYLMPKTHALALIDEIYGYKESHLPFLDTSSAGHVLTVYAIRKFDVSKAAAIVRLKQLNMITNNQDIAKVIR